MDITFPTFPKYGVLITLIFDPSDIIISFSDKLLILDWSVGLGLFEEDAKSYLKPKITSILKTVSNAGKIATMNISGPEEARHYYQQGVRIFFVGVDVSMKQFTLEQTITPIKKTLSILNT